MIVWVVIAAANAVLFVLAARRAARREADRRWWRPVLHDRVAWLVGGVAGVAVAVLVIVDGTLIGLPSAVVVAAVVMAVVGRWRVRRAARSSR